ncbi:hypothetical protein [Okeania sp. SIO1F9]|nr:hypothetical protein [Okeania sp. SIO1F9]NET75955.1 hypothetical protein [Okeania sp. SIO1F9]
MGVGVREEGNIAYFSHKKFEEGDRRQETGDRRKITWGFSPQVILNTV